MRKATLLGEYFIDEEGERIARPGAEVEVVAVDCPYEGKSTVHIVGDDTDFEVDSADLA